MAEGVSTGTASFDLDQGSWERICRRNPHSYFKEDLEQRVYASPSDALAGLLNGAVETEVRSWWVECSSGGTTVVQRHYVFKIWEISLDWLARIAPVIDRLVPELKTGNVVVKLDLSEIAGQNEWEIDAINAIPPISKIPVSASSPTIDIFVPRGYLSLVNSVHNTAERLLVDAFIEGALKLARIADARCAFPHPLGD